MNMLHDSWWISTIDHRVSTALVFFLLLMTMGMVVVNGPLLYSGAGVVRERT